MPTPPQRGRPHSITLSVIREIVSLEMLTPYTAPRKREVPPGEVRADFPGRQAAGEQRQDDRVHVVQAALPLLDDDRLERAVPVSRDLDHHLPGRGGGHRLGAGSVAGVGIIPSLGCVFVVAEVLGHLLLESDLKDVLG